MASQVRSYEPARTSYYGRIPLEVNGVITGLLAWACLASQVLPEPPAMPKRSIAPRTALEGVREELEEGGQKLTFYLPKFERPRRPTVLTIHFHSATWHAVQEHVDRGLSGPLIAFYPGEGSAIYERAFSDPARLDRWIALAQSRMAAHGWPQDATIEKVDITSFSAGYGAVRQLVSQPTAFARLRRVVLADSLYGGLQPPTPEMPFRIPANRDVEVWRPLAEAAIRGEKTFAITCSEVPTPAYASSSEVALDLVLKLNGSPEPVLPETPAAREPDFPLKARYDRGRFHVWFYGGQDGPAHMTHARHLADIWKALDRAGAP